MDTQKGFLRLTGTGESTVGYEGECAVKFEPRQVVIEYDESAAGYDGTRTFLVLSEDTVTLNRVGRFPTVMVFGPKGDSPVRMGSPYGELELRLVTDALEIVRGADAVRATLSYRFLIGDTSISNVLKLECRAAGREA